MLSNSVLKDTSFHLKYIPAVGGTSLHVIELLSTSASRDCFIMTGIYKITNPNGNVYIGQSTNLSERFREYKKVRCKTQIKLYASFIKYGFSNHNIEIIEYCDSSALNEREIFHISFFNSYKNGLNGTFGGNGITDAVKEKISKSALGHKRNVGRKHSQEAIQKMKLARIGIKRAPFTKEWIEKIRAKTTGRKFSPESIERMKLSQSKRDNSIYKNVYPIHLIEAGRKRNASVKGICRTEQEKDNIRNGMPKNPVIDLSTYVIYQTSKEAAEKLGINRFTLSWYLTGRRKSGNPTPIIYLKDFKFI